MTIEVMLVSDVRLYREGLYRVLSEDKRIGTVEAVASRAEAMKRVGAIKPDVVLLDMAMSNNFSIIREIVLMAPETKIVALAVPESTTEVVACVEAGVAGYVTCEGSLEELIQTIEAAVTGELNCSPRIAGCLRRRLATLAAEHRESNPLAELTSRELHILDLIEKGFPNKEIARALNIEVATVKNHVHHILRKLHVSHRSEAAALRRQYNAHGDRITNSP